MSLSDFAMGSGLRRDSSNRPGQSTQRPNYPSRRGPHLVPLPVRNLNAPRGNNPRFEPLLRRDQPPRNGPGNITPRPPSNYQTIDVTVSGQMARLSDQLIDAMCSGKPITDTNNLSETGAPLPTHLVKNTLMYSMLRVHGPRISDSIRQYDKKDARSDSICKSIITLAPTALLDLFNTKDKRLFFSKFKKLWNPEHARLPRSEISRIPLYQFDIYEKDAIDRMGTELPAADQTSDLRSLTKTYVRHFFEGDCVDRLSLAIDQLGLARLEGMWFNTDGFRDFARGLSGSYLTKFKPPVFHGVNDYDRNIDARPKTLPFLPPTPSPKTQHTSRHKWCQRSRSRKLQGEQGQEDAPRRTSPIRNCQKRPVQRQLHQRHQSRRS